MPKKKGHYLVSQAFVIINQLGRAIESINRSCTPQQKDGPPCIYFILSQREVKKNHGEALLVYLKKKKEFISF